MPARRCDSDFLPELVAGAALPQARPDWFQSRLAGLGERVSGAPPQG